jgi:hypothetical protein
VASTGEDLHRRVAEMDLNAVAIELDLMNPPLAAGHLVN